MNQVKLQFPDSSINFPVFAHICLPRCASLEQLPRRDPDSHKGLSNVAPYRARRQLQSNIIPPSTELFLAVASPTFLVRTYKNQQNERTPSFLTTHGCWLPSHFNMCLCSSKVVLKYSHRSREDQIHVLCSHAQQSPSQNGDRPETVDGGMCR